MTVKEILKLVASALQLQNTKKYLDGGEATDSALSESEKLIECYNSVISELCEEYLPVKATQSFVVNDGKIAFSDFNNMPLEIKACFVDGVEVTFSTNPLYVSTQNGNVMAVYEYYPAPANLNDDCPYQNTKISARIIALGVQREYLLASGMFEEAMIYDNKFRQALSSVMINRKLERLKARGWY